MTSWLKFLLPVSFVLALAWGGLNLVPRLNPTKVNADFLKETGDIKKEAIETVSLQDKEGTAEVAKVGGLWRLEGRKVVSSKIDEILEAFFNKQNIFTLISQNQKSQEELGVASASARRLFFKDTNQKKLEVLIGHYSFPGNFIRIGESNNIYLSPSLLDSLISSNKQDLWDKTILLPKKEEINLIKIMAGGKTTTITKQDNKYYLQTDSTGSPQTGQQELNLEKVNQYLTTLSSLSAEKIIVEKNEKRNYPRILGEVRLEAKSQRESLKFYAGKNEILLERTSDGSFFTISPITGDSLLKPQIN